MKTFFRAVTAFVALAILPFASVIAESGIETKSTCLSQACDKASHGALVETKSYVWKEPDFGGNGVELHGYKVGDVWWAPGWATNSGEGGQEPVKTVLTKMEYVPSTLWQGYMQWNYHYDVYEYNLPPGVDVGTEVSGGSIYWIDQAFYECSSGVWMTDRFGLPWGVKSPRSDSSTPGKAQWQSPNLSNAGAAASGGSGGGCSSCSQAGQSPGEFELVLGLGDNRGGSIDWKFSGNLASADLLASSFLGSFDELAIYPGVTVTGSATAGTVVVKDSSTMQEVATTLFESTTSTTVPGQLYSLTITVTPVDSAIQPTVHTFTRVQQATSGGASLAGIRYTRAVTGGEPESVEFYNSGLSGTVADSDAIQGVFRSVNVAGDKETLTALPETAGTFTWVTSSAHPNGGYYAGTLSEIHEFDPAADGHPTVTTTRTFAKIGTAAKSQRVLIAEEATQGADSEVTLYGYDDRIDLMNPADPTLVALNAEFGRIRQVYPR